METYNEMIAGILGKKEKLGGLIEGLRRRKMVERLEEMMEGVELDPDAIPDELIIKVTGPNGVKHELKITREQWEEHLKDSSKYTNHLSIERKPNQLNPITRRER